MHPVAYALAAEAREDCASRKRHRAQRGAALEVVVESNNVQGSVIGRSPERRPMPSLPRGHNGRIGGVRAGGYTDASVPVDGTVFREVRASATLYATLPGI